MKTAAVVLALLAILCVEVSADQRVINGEDAVPHSYPYQVSLQSNTKGDHKCGGSLISAQWVLTAAHCVDNKNKLYVVLGAHNIKDKEETQQRIGTSGVIIHPGWNRKEVENDIALVELEEPARLDGTTVKIIRLPKLSDKKKSFYNWDATLTGWGRTSANSDALSDILQTITERIMANLVCKAAFLFQIVKDTNICLHGIRFKSGCHGDSGGPLIVTEEDGERTLVGVVSFGFPTCEIWPSVFTRVPSYLEWISKKTGIPTRN